MKTWWNFVKQLKFCFLPNILSYTTVLKDKSILFSTDPEVVVYKILTCSPQTLTLRQLPAGVCRLSAPPLTACPCTPHADFVHNTFPHLLVLAGRDLQELGQ